MIVMLLAMIKMHINGSTSEHAIGVSWWNQNALSKTSFSRSRYWIAC